jgi:hypothetical protein
MDPMPEPQIHVAPYNGTGLHKCRTEDLDMKLQETTLATLKSVAGVYAVRPIIRGKALALRQGRDGHELAQDDGQAVRVVAVSDIKPSLLSFAAINGIPVKNYTDMAVTRPKPKAPSAPKPPKFQNS